MASRCERVRDGSGDGAAPGAGAKRSLSTRPGTDTLRVLAASRCEYGVSCGRGWTSSSESSSSPQSSTGEPEVGGAAGAGASGAGGDGGRRACGGDACASCDAGGLGLRRAGRGDRVGAERSSSAGGAAGGGE